MPMKSDVLDVACGPGWTSHYLAKLGHRVVGVDISGEMIEMARLRMASDPYPPYPELPFKAEFRVHDVESGPLEDVPLFEAAIFEACVHHFYDPILALKNVSRNLKPDGIIAIMEASAPEIGSKYSESDHKIMKEYQTLERPLSRKQMIRLLRLSGFEHFQFYYPINGYFAQTKSVAELVGKWILKSREWNVIIASKSAERMRQISPQFTGVNEREPSLNFFPGFYPEQTRADKSRYRWSSIKSSIVLKNVDELELLIGSLVPKMCNRQQTIFIYIDRELHTRIELSERLDSFRLTIPDLRASSRIDFFSDSAFSPKWVGDKDDRVLSFTVEVISIKQTKPAAKDGLSSQS